MIALCTMSFVIDVMIEIQILVKISRFFIPNVTPAKSTSLGDRLCASREGGTEGRWVGVNHRVTAHGCDWSLL